jgi:hypothetical protein
MSETETSEADEKAPYTKLTTKVKRGTGTRDQDTVKVVTRHPDPTQAAQDHQKAIEAVRLAARAARSIQPEDPTDE